MLAERGNPTGSPAQRFVNADAARPSDRTLPNDEAPPALLIKLQRNLQVPFSVTPDLRLPEQAACTGKAKEAAVMSVPEAAVNEYGCTVARQDEIRPARYVLSVETKPESESMKSTADQALGTGVAASYATHHAAARHLVDDVHSYANCASNSGWISDCSLKKGFTARATSLTTGTTTELPNCW